MSFYARLAFRNLFRHKFRSLATIIGISLGIAAVLATLSVGDNVRANISSTLEAAAGKADLLVTPGAQGRAVFNSDDVLDTVRADPDVLSVYPVLNYRAEPVRDVQGVADSVIPGVNSGFQLSGRVTEVSDDLPAELASGELPQAGSNGVAIASGFAELRGIELGEDLEFSAQAGTLTFKVVGILDDSIGYASTNAGRVGVVNLQDLQEAVNLGGRASFLDILLRDTADSDAVQSRLESQLGEAYAVTLPAGSGNIAFGIVDTLQAGLRILAATLLALGGFMAYNTFAAAIVERTREYALLRTVCMTKAQVKRLALTEAFILSIIGVLAGIGLGVLLAYGIVRVNAVLLGFSFRTLVIPAYSVGVASITGVLVALLAGYLPATAASNTAPVVAARSAVDAGQIERPHLGWPLIALGIVSALLPWPGIWALVGAVVSMVSIFLGITFVTPWLLKPTIALMTPLLTGLFGVAGKLGADFARRNAVRNGVAIGTVVIGVSLTLGVGSMVAGINRAIERWVDTTIVGDLFVSSPTSFPADFETRIAEEVPEIDAVSGVGVRIVRFEPENQPRARSVALVLVDPERFNPEAGFGRFQYIEGEGDNLKGYEALRAGGKVLAANTIKDRFGVQTGDEVSLRTNEGFQNFEVEGIVVDFTGGGETFIGSINDSDLFGGGTPDLYVMTLQEGVSPQVVKDSLVESFPELFLDVTLNQTYRERILALTQQTFTTTNGLLGLAIFIAALGVANTLGMNLVNRQHDIAVLRTLGLTRRDIGQIIFSEGTIVAVLGTLLGLATGFLLARIITDGANALTGFVIEPYIPLRLVLIALLASPVLGLVASLLPARRAAKQSPVVALGGAQ